ncbi:diphthamide biosynthesis enzyme Dph2 [Methanosarcina sp. KYL-1]|uniref:diphthamide biosynthesis enzyme Dph2 n=1 Tax=Methanosarcina sp. KYL-1 TaxID=2602068 RepID=UPI0021019FB5|nr:diphthamide biosynthesis enzyme Dph2 [Methanosarcina sp. KYL-1]MCQ1536059.1 diphthamide biosynthesis enzyme Dph2 [Methanosarcina sp. KYL-1]
MSLGISEAFDLRLDYLIDVVRKTGAKLVGFQFPEGLKRKGPELAKRVEEATGAEVLISGDPCFGACDLDRTLLGHVDLLFHFGHAELEDTKLSEKVYFIETRSAVDVLPVVEKALQELKGQRIGLITTVQHVHKLQEACKLLETRGKTCVIGRGDSRLAYPGQVLGCNFSAARAEACDEYLYIGSGDFHPLGVSLSTKKRVLVANPLSGEVREVDPSRVLRQRSAVIARSLDAEVFGIIVSSKNGQKRMELASSLKALAKKHEKEAHLILIDLVTPDQLLQFKVDAFVNTACPRLAIDEVGRFPAPMLTPQEFEIVLGERDWEHLVLDEITEEPV